MKNILLAIQAEKLNVSDIDFGCHIAALSRSRLTGVFLENNSTAELPALKTFLGFPYVETIVSSDLPDYPERQAIIKKNKALFKERCLMKGVRHSIHLDKAIPRTQIKMESRFADLLLINSTMNFDGEEEEELSDFVQDVLVQSECPVLVCPKEFTGIDEIIFTYDGGASAAFAIRQFTNIFPELDEEKITVLQVRQDDEPIDEQNLKQYLGSHYSSASFNVIHGETQQELFQFLFERKKALLVMGAYGRSRISRSLSSSTAEKLMLSLPNPIFITHP